MSNALSQLAGNILAAAAYDKLVVIDATPAKAHQLLNGVTPDQLLTAPVRSAAQGYTILAGLWLLHDALDEAHKIAQMNEEDLRRVTTLTGKSKLKTPLKVGLADTVEGDASNELTEAAAAANDLAFWHAIMHRREGDFSNSKYWYARVKSHPVFQSMANHFGPAVNTMPADRTLLRMVAHGFDAGAWVDFVEDVYRHPTPARTAAAVHLQQLEWRALFDHCTRI